MPAASQALITQYGGAIGIVWGLSTDELGGSKLLWSISKSKTRSNFHDFSTCATEQPNVLAVGKLQCRMK